MSGVTEQGSCHVTAADSDGAAEHQVGCTGTSKAAMLPDGQIPGRAHRNCWQEKISPGWLNGTVRVAASASVLSLLHSLTAGRVAEEIQEIQCAATARLAVWLGLRGGTLPIAGFARLPLCEKITKVDQSDRVWKPLRCPGGKPIVDTLAACVRCFSARELRVATVTSGML